ncbi:hypothetical protein FHX42_001198 [Saccharopolyspora lacisalsi]|uniref:DUF397 domain-containing protein n=1 Tax=Halosaccharopolyspora lacisalsi TaxID=1000566 RepID=A0A839DSZ2_9PSEU|nr:hypothetical protein [Halosaccharopolyspora lacisalsi]
MPSATGVRDTKLGEVSPVLAFTRTQWSSFLQRVQDGCLDV